MNIIIDLQKLEKEIHIFLKETLISNEIDSRGIDKIMESINKYYLTYNKK